jgi:hypothetical protein
MYQASIPVFVRMFGNLSAILDKAASFGETRKIEDSALITYRLAPDMLPFSRQVQIACDMALRGAARLAGVEPPSNPDTETNFAELKARVDVTVKFLEGLSAAQIDGAESKPITIKTPTRELNFTGQSYLANFILPNFYFHLTATYLILRHNGVDLGKTDFIGAL